MDTTRVSLIQAIKNPENTQAWSEFYGLYGPLLYRYARTKGLSRDDAEDIRSQCIEVVVQQIGGFKYEKAKGGFKNWLRRVAYNKIVDLIRKRHEKQAMTGEMEAHVADQTAPDDVWDRQWKNAHLRFALERVKTRVSEPSYLAFQLLVFDGAAVEEVCSRTEMNSNQVYKAKSRILALLRDELIELGLSLEDY
jgi:RNA polymerase sigma-70 factor, ECF subfamily